MSEAITFPDAQPQGPSGFEILDQKTEAALAENERARQVQALEDARNAEIEDYKTTEEFRMLQDAAELDIYGSRGTVWHHPTEKDVINGQERPRVIADEKNTIPGKIETLRNSGLDGLAAESDVDFSAQEFGKDVTPSTEGDSEAAVNEHREAKTAEHQERSAAYTAKKAANEKAASSYEADVQGMLDDGFELSQAKLVMDMRELRAKRMAQIKEADERQFKQDALAHKRKVEDLTTDFEERVAKLAQQEKAAKGLSDEEATASARERLARLEPRLPEAPTKRELISDAEFERRLKNVIKREGIFSAEQLERYRNREEPRGPITPPQPTDPNAGRPSIEDVLEQPDVIAHYDAINNPTDPNEGRPSLEDVLEDPDVIAHYDAINNPAEPQPATSAPGEEGEEEKDGGLPYVSKDRFNLDTDEARDNAVMSARGVFGDKLDGLVADLLNSNDPDASRHNTFLTRKQVDDLMLKTQPWAQTSEQRADAAKALFEYMIATGSVSSEAMDADGVRFPVMGLPEAVPSATSAPAPSVPTRATGVMPPKKTVAERFGFSRKPAARNNSTPPLVSGARSSEQARDLLGDITLDLDGGDPANRMPAPEVARNRRRLGSTAVMAALREGAQRRWDSRRTRAAEDTGAVNLGAIGVGTPGPAWPAPVFGQVRGSRPPEAVLAAGEVDEDGNPKS